jgi:hypothetical protein
VELKKVKIEKMGAFFAMPQKTGLSAPIFWLRQKDFRFYPLRTQGFLRFAQFNSIKRE